MVRRLFIVALLVGLLVVPGLWVAAGCLGRSNPARCIVVGFAQSEQWLIIAGIHSDGFVSVRRFSTNLTLHDGLFVKTSPLVQQHTLSLRSMFPQMKRVRAPGPVAWSAMFHLLPLTVLCLLGAGYLVVTPIVRRRRRRKRGLCLACGYNLAGNESGRCPECGKEIDSAS